SSYAIKQGWGDDDDCNCHAVFNSTGYVSGARYAVAILTLAPLTDYGSPISRMLTAEARFLMPNGNMPDGASAGNPRGHLDVLRASGSTVQIAGWTYDPSAPTTSLKVAVFDNSTLVASAPTTIARPDVNQVFKITGTHGYDWYLAVADGKHTFCVV